ncbi:MAG: hypothetical protein PHW60_02685 [Kiritimatiellae bacterium]|nr:hypothetical protein [Kiritimatiellia bacterium]
MGHRFFCAATLVFSLFSGASLAASAPPNEGGTNADFHAVVCQAYADLLNRVPDKDGLAVFVRRMSDFGLTEQELREEIFNSREYRNRTFIHGAFADNGDIPDIHWPTSYPDIKPALWTSRITNGCSTGSYVSAAFEAPRRLFFYFAGYPGEPSNRITLCDITTHKELEFRPAYKPGAMWRLAKWQPGTNWTGRMVRLIATDNSVLPDHGWLGISAPLLNHKPNQWHAFMIRAFYVAGLCCLHFLLFLLPGLALALLIPPKFMQKSCRLLTATLILSGAWGYVAFWVYFTDCFAGKLFSGTSVVMVLFALIKNRRRLLTGSMARELLWPAAIVASVSIFVLSLGFLYGGTKEPLVTSATRFSHALPVDQYLPIWGAAKIYSGSSILAKNTDAWRFSDRPPLQTGIVLLQSPLFMHSKCGNRNLDYLCLAVSLQCLSLAGLWILIRKLKAGSLVVFGVFSFIVFSPTFIVNSFFVWPKLLAVPFLFIVTAELLFQDRCEDRGDDCITGLIIGSSAAVSMLAHGGSIFGLIGIALATLLLRRMPSMRTILYALVIFVVAMLSWMIFQKAFDPPGDGLIKMHIGGSLTPWDGRTLLATIVDSYSGLSFAQIIKMKLINLAYTVNYVPAHMPPLSSTNLSSVLYWVRQVLFFWLIPSLGPLVLTLPGLVLFAPFRRAGTPVSSAGFKCLLVACATTATWCLVMFQGTCIHQGTLFNPLVLTAGLALVCFWLSRGLGSGLLALQMGMFAVLYVPLSRLYVHWHNTTWYYDLDAGMCVMMVLALGAYIALLRKAPC